MGGQRWESTIFLGRIVLKSTRSNAKSSDRKFHYYTVQTFELSLSDIMLVKEKNNYKVRN